MAEQTIPARVVRTCDRCRVELTAENTRENREQMTKMTSQRFMRKAGVFRGFGRKPEVLVSDVHFCDGCWWEFDCLFCQGLGVNPAPGVRVYIPQPHEPSGRGALVPVSGDSETGEQ